MRFGSLIIGFALAALGVRAEKAVIACDIVSHEELAKILGVAFKRGVTAGDQHNVSQCTFERDGREGGVGVTLFKDNGDESFQAFEGLPGAKKLKGLADKVVFSAKLRQVALLRGDRAVSITVNFAHGEPAKVLTEIAKAAAQRL
jgi:hypothetical protein